MKKKLQLFSVAMAVAVLSGCAGAAFNRVEMKSVRNVSVGKELMDLQEAHEKGIINDSEYAQAKQEALKLLNNCVKVEQD